MLVWEETMRLFQVVRRSSIFAGRESGVSLLETVVALAVLGTIAVVFLTGLVTTSKAAFMVDERATAESLARSQMEWAKNSDYVYDTTEYSPAPMPSGKDYINYSATIAAEPLDSPDDGIQKITVIVKHSGEEVIKLEGYKVNR
jgi:type II secretory pathway pseudopilin PulG